MRTRGFFRFSTSTVLDERAQEARTAWQGLTSKLRGMFAVATALIMLTGCAGGGLELLNDAAAGPGVRLDAEEVRESKNNYLDVVQSIRQRAGLLETPRSGSPEWDTFIEAGFGYVDEKCNGFIEVLFRTERRKQLLLSQTTLVGTSVSAMVGHATGLNQAARALTLLADAMGLVHGTIENYYESLLFKMRPSTIQTMVNRLRASHRVAFRRAPGSYRDQTRSMTQIADYLSICLPSNLEATIETTLSQTAFLRNPDGTYSGVNANPLQNQKAIDEATNGENRRERTDRRISLELKTLRDQSRGYIPRTGGAQKPSTPNYVPPAKPTIKALGGLNAYERNLSRKQAINLQSRLCIANPTGNLGPATSPTRQAIREFNVLLGYKDDNGAGILDAGVNRDILSHLPANCRRDYGGVFEAFTLSSRVKRKAFVARLGRSLKALASQPDMQDVLRKNAAQAFTFQASKITGVQTRFEAYSGAQNKLRNPRWKLTTEVRDAMEIMSVASLFVYSKNVKPAPQPPIVVKSTRVLTRHFHAALSFFCDKACK